MAAFLLNGILKGVRWCLRVVFIASTCNSLNFSHAVIIFSSLSFSLKFVFSLVWSWRAADRLDGKSFVTGTDTAPPYFLHKNTNKLNISAKANVASWIQKRKCDLRGLFSVRLCGNVPLCCLLTWLGCAKHHHAACMVHSYSREWSKILFSILTVYYLMTWTFSTLQNALYDPHPEITF